MSFKIYLERKAKNPKVVEGYLYYQEQFIKWLETENLSLEACQYVDLLSYVKKLKSKERSPYNLNNYLRGIRYYYEWLQAENKIKHNPARKLYIKGQTQQLPSDLLSKKEMNHIYVDYPPDSYRGQTIVQQRNKVLIGLVVYQAMRLDELAQLRVEDINLYKGTIYIKKTGRGAKNIETGSSSGATLTGIHQ